MTQNRRSGDSERFPPLPQEIRPPSPKRRGIGRRGRPRTPEEKARDRLYNVIAALFALGTVAALGIVLFLWGNYNSPLNPLAPPTPLPIVITATYTPTLTLTPSPTLTPSETYTPSPIPSLTPSLTFTPIFLEGFSTPNGTPAPEGSEDFSYTLQHDAVLYLTNPDARGGCRWSSIAGSVMNYEGQPVNGYQIHVVGEGVDQTVVSGSAPGFGPGGFEVQLGSVARDASYVAQLLDNEGRHASPVYTVTTRADCNYTIAVLHFVAVLPSS